MTLSSYSFIVVFLPIVMIGYYFFLNRSKNNIQWYWLIVASFFFYACGTPVYLLLLIFDMIINYTIYQVLIRKRKKAILVFGIAFNVSLLLLFKYLNFGIDIVNLFFDANLTIINVVVPMGISFITFQQIAFLVDTYRESEDKRDKINIAEYSLFITFFPHLVSGPIITKKEFFPLLEKTSEINWEKLASGIYLFFMGFGKKVLIADFLAKGVDYGYANLDSINTTTALCISVLYTLQIYLDFSGYSDMAIGVARMLQLDLPVNFNSPYKAATIVEFWDRWHITLTKFLTQYIYIPLGGNRKGRIRTYLNIIIVFFISGLWHGASYTFILWGLLHGIFMVITRQGDAIIRKLPRWINRIITLCFINFTWVLFRAGSLRTIKEYVSALLKNNWGKIDDNVLTVLIPSFIKRLLWKDIPVSLVVLVMVIIIIFVILFAKNTYEQMEGKQFTLKSLILVIAIGLMGIMSMSGTTTFIYAYF